MGHGRVQTFKEASRLKEFIVALLVSNMAITAVQMAIIVGVLGLISFILGVLAETKKPAAGTPIPGKDVVICKYPSSPTVVLGSLSFVFLIASSVFGYLSVFYPYRGKQVPQSILFKSMTSPSSSTFLCLQLEWEQCFYYGQPSQSNF